MNKQEIEIVRIGTDLFNFIPYVKIQEPGELSKEYELWPHLEDLFHQLLHEKLIDAIKAKQVGVSWALSLYALWRIYTVPAFRVLEFSKGLMEAQELLNKARIIYYNLPKELQIYEVEPNSTQAFGLKRVLGGRLWDSKITAYPSTESAGIGETAGLVIHDEAHFHEFYEQNLSHTRATVADSPDRQLISVSTITKADSHFKTHWQEAAAGRNGFKALFYGYDARPGRDESFLEQMYRENEGREWVVESNYPRTIEEALSPLGVQSCFKKEAIEALKIREPKETRRGYINIWEKPRVGIQYVGGGDVAEGVGGDYSCLTITGKEGLHSEVVASIYTNQLATDLFAWECDQLGREYFNCLLGVENNTIGVAVINKLLELNYPNLYYGDDKKQKPGWATGERNRYVGIIELTHNIDNGSLTTPWDVQIKELSEFQWVKRREKITAQPTGKTHGDTVMSLMLANQMGKKVGNAVEPQLWFGGKRVW